MREALQAGVDPNSTDGPMQRSCLMVAILNDHKEVVDLLLSWPSIQVNAKDRQNSSALHLACYSGNVVCLNKLLTIPGLRLNEKDHQGRTPIMRAIKYGKIEAVRVMTAVDEVDLEVKDNQGRDLEEFASWSVGWQSLIFSMHCVSSYAHTCKSYSICTYSFITCRLFDEAYIFQGRLPVPKSCKC